jgi:hypothetical protein
MNRWKAATIVLAVVLAVVLVGSMFRPVQAETQPQMRSALSHLQAALVDLQQATGDKGGHRAKAIDFTRKAINQTEQGIAFDNRH